DAAPQVLLAVARFERPNVRQCPPVVLWEGGSRLRLLELLPLISGDEDLHAEEGVATRRIQARRAARVDQRRIDRHARSEGSAQRERTPRLRRLGNEKALLGPDRENDSLRHVQPPETAGRIVTTSPGTSTVSTPSRSRM